jgi:hypothetical protein
LCERLGTVPQVGSRAWAAASSLGSAEEILEIVGVVVNISVWTRIKLAEGAIPGARPEAETDRPDDLGRQDRCPLAYIALSVTPILCGV